MDPEEQIRELQNLLKKSEEEKQAAQQQLQLAVVEKAKIENEALKRKSSDAYRTPERSVVRSDSGGKIHLARKAKFSMVLASSGELQRVKLQPAQ